MRVKSRWFDRDRPRSAAQTASVVAFIVWRTAKGALDRMRAAGFDIDAGERYFAFLREFLAFLIAVADRMAYARLPGSTRADFTTALANRVGEVLDENESRLLDVSAADSKRRFIALVNDRASDYATFECIGDEPDFAFLRYLGACVTDLMPAKDRRWTLEQVIEIEAPQAVATLRKAMLDLFAGECAKGVVPA